ncbi:MAG TPA: choice-of-anchor D domain-containing protein, partial [Candidatus Kapabacteria bacterium]|nr:choice-of-anchor D domain-containing protein [Candidatus Kapabacteria bacterium]
SADPIAVFVDENPLGGFSNDDEKLYADDFWYQPLPAERCGTRYYMQPYRYLGTSDLNGGMVSMHDTTLVFENFKNVLVSPTPPESLLAGNTLLPVNLTDVAHDTIAYDTAGKDSIGYALLISSSKPMWMVSYDGFSDRSGNGTTGEYGEEYGGGGATIYPITDWGKEYYIMPQSPPYRPWPRNWVIYITAALDSTIVRVDSDNVFILNAGQYTFMNAKNGFSHIVASKRIQVVEHFDTVIYDLHSPYYRPGVDNYYPAVPAVEQYLTDVYFVTPSSLIDTVSGGAQNSISLIHPTATTESLTLDGVPVTAQWIPILDGEYSTAELQVAPGAHHLHSNSPFMAEIHGWEQVEDDYEVGIDSVYYDYLPSFNGYRNMIDGTTQVHAGTLDCRTPYIDTSINIYNLGIDPLRVDSITIVGTNPGAFSLRNVSFPIIIPAYEYMNGGTNDTAKVIVRFTPPYAGNFSAALLVYSNDMLNSPYHVWLSGAEDSIGYALSDTVIDFGKVATCINDTSITLTVTNTGNVPLNGQLNISGFPAFYKGNAPAFPLDTGRSTQLNIHFAHQADSTYTGSVTLYTQCDSIVIPIRGEGVTPHVLASDTDLGATCSGTTINGYVILTNAGDTTATVTSLSVAAPFKVDSPAVPFKIPAHDSIRVRAKFSPMADGQFSKTLTIVGQPCNVTATAMLTGASGTPALTSTGADFGNVCLGDTARQTIILRNTGSVAATVNMINVSSGFIVLTQLPITINAGESQAVTLAFVPTTAAAYTSLVDVQGSPCNVTTKSQVQGVGVSVALSAQGVDFGAIALGTTKDSTIVITNSGTSSITVQLQTNSPFSIDSTSITISGGSSVTVGIHYLPAQAEKDSSTLQLSANTPCSAFLTVMLTGADTITSTTTTQSAELCSTPPAPVLPAIPIDLPITLSNNIITPIDSVGFDLLYDPTALLYETTTSALCTLSQRRIKPGEVHIILTNCGTPFNAGNVADARFVGLISSRDTIFTQVVIDSVTFYPTGSVSGSGCSVPVTIDPLCGLKGVLYAGATSLAQNYPNPFTGTTAIHVTLSPDDMGHAQLLIYNMIGTLVADLSSQVPQNGDVTFSPKGLPAGVYLYTLITPTRRFSRIMTVSE